MGFGWNGDTQFVFFINKLSCKIILFYRLHGYKVWIFNWNFDLKIETNFQKMSPTHFQNHKLELIQYAATFSICNLPKERTKS